MAESGQRVLREVAQTLHDSLCQTLSGASLMAGVLAARVTAGETLRPTDMADLEHMLAHGLDEIRSLSRALKTVPAGPDGLMAALQQLATGISGEPRCEFECPEPVFLQDADAALALYTIAQEAVRNAARHAGASLIRVCLKRCDRGIVLTIADNGSGFTPPDDAHRISGIEIMRCHADSIGADLVIESGAAKGTTVTCELPLESGGI